MSPRRRCTIVCETPAALRSVAAALIKNPCFGSPIRWEIGASSMASCLVWLFEVVVVVGITRIGVQMKWRAFLFDNRSKDIFYHNHGALLNVIHAHNSVLNELSGEYNLPETARGLRPAQHSPHEYLSAVVMAHLSLVGLAASLVRSHIDMNVVCVHVRHATHSLQFCVYATQPRSPEGAHTHRCTYTHVHCFWHWIAGHTVSQHAIDAIVCRTTSHVPK